MKRVEYERENEKIENEDVHNGKKGRKMGMALYCSTIYRISAVYGVSNLLCVFCKYE